MIVVFVLGSKSDLPHAQKIANVLNDYSIKNEIYVSSAHKVPTKTLEIINKFNEKKETIVFVTIAGRSNALSGVVAGATHFPVIACPPFSDKSDYLTNVHSTLQMPSETPVLAIMDPENCAQAVLRILSLSDKDLTKKITNHMKLVQAGFDTNPVQV